jgi:hypothetical protein
VLRRKDADWSLACHKETTKGEENHHDSLPLSGL